MRNNRDERKLELDWRKCALALGISIILLLTVTAAGAALVERETIGAEWMNYLAALALLSSSFAGGMVGRSGENRWLAPLVNGGGLWLFLLAVNALGYDGDLNGAVPVALAILGGSGAAILPGRGGKRRRSGGRKRRNR